MERGCHSLWKMIQFGSGRIIWKLGQTLSWTLKIKRKEGFTFKSYLNSITKGASVFKAIEALIMMGQRGLPPSFALTSGSYAVSKGQFQETWDELVTQCGSSRPKLESKCGNDYVWDYEKVFKNSSWGWGDRYVGKGLRAKAQGPELGLPAPK